MDFNRLAQRAKQIIDQRGGPESAKQDADELRNIARGPGTLSDKAKRAGEALREPGAGRGRGADPGPGAGREADAGREPGAERAPGVPPRREPY